MRELFIKKRFNAKSRTLLSKIVEIEEKYAGKGMDLSLRQVYYLLVGAGHLPKGKDGKERLKIYKNLGNLITDARFAGIIDWNTIRDNTRLPSIPQPNDSIPNIIACIPQMFRTSMWTRQPAYVEVFVEKQALDGVLTPLCWELDVPFSSNKGYSSSSAYYDASKRFLAAADQGKELHLIYLGDHDASGIDMTRDIDDRFTIFTSGETFTESKLAVELSGIDPRPIQVHRVALNMNQVRSMKLISAIGSDKDSRMAEYYRRFGTKDIWELAAVEPETMVELVREAVEKLVDKKIWDEDKAREKEGRDTLQRFADTYDQESQKAFVPVQLEREIIYLPKVKKARKPSKKKEPKRPNYEI